MNVLAIDLGTYSVKIIEAQIERRKSSIIRKKEVTISSAADQLPQGMSVQEVQFEIIKRYIKANQFSGKIIFQTPNSILTRRFLTLPVNNKRKAEMMIPFQLDNSLPYPSTEAHYTTNFSSKQKNLNVMMDISSIENFEHFYSQLIQHNIRPSVLTSELSVINAVAHLNKKLSSYIIIDFGHTTTKVYFIYNQTVISSHTSYVAGASIDEAISQTYNIPLGDATFYKHDNCFMLTDNQYDDVTEEQAEFATLMRNIFTPFISDFKRWEIAQRISTSGSFDQIFIIGGTSNIKNISNFLTQNLSYEVELYKVDDYLKFPLHQENLAKNIQFSIATVMALAAPTSGLLSTFLTGTYTSSSSQAISAHSTAFIMARGIFVSIIILISLFIERQFMHGQEKKLNRYLDKRIKLVSELSRPLQFQYRKKPQKILKILKGKTKLISKELQELRDALNISAIKPLYQLSNIIKSNKNIYLAKLSTQNGKTTAEFSSDNYKELTILKQHLKMSTIQDASLKLEEKTKMLVIKFTEAGL